MTGPELTFDGVPVPFREGQTVGAALTAAGISSWRSTRGRGEPRGLFCGIGVCFDCLLTVDDRRAQRACVTPACDGQTVLSDDPARPLPGANHD
ncbi:(2Fe-2S)-binding protein [Microbacterium sp. NPDC055910]|uniref:(2Fe-2S)-binding protein n=1 Tax=Microbacterium sp. NPDC055910 TaxID=3345659 RepID=UPI0035E1F18B